MSHTVTSNAFLYKIKRTTLIKVSLGLILLLSPMISMATHIAAAQLYADYISTKKYRITLEMIADCDGINPSNSEYLEYKNDCNSISYATSMARDNNNSNVIVTGALCANVSTTCTSPSSNVAGYKKYTYRATVTLPIDCDAWTFMWQQSYRNGAVINLSNPTSTYMCVRLKLFTITKPINNTPRFTSNAVQYFGVNTANTLSNAHVDPESDSTSFASYIPSEDCVNNNATYANGYNLNNPIAASAAGGGYSVNAINGSATFTPTVQGGFALAFRMTEYDASSGAVTSQVDRDMQVFVVNNSGSAPGIDSFSVPNASAFTPINNLQGASFVSYTPAVLTTCAGNTVSFDFSGQGGAANSQLYLYGDQNTTATGANLTVTGAGTSSVYGSFQYSPTISDTGKHVITFSIVDSNCTGSTQLVRKSFLVVTLYVHWGSVDAGPDVTICSMDTASINPTGTPNINTWNWTDLNGNTPTDLAVPTNQNVQVWPSTTTSYIVSTDLDPNCANTDTVVVTLSPPITFAGAITQAPPCIGGQGAIVSVAAGGTAPYTYSINGGTTTQNNGLFTNLSAGTYTLTVEDATGCTADSVLTIVDPAPIVINSTITDVSCFGNLDGEVTATASGGTAPYTYSLDGGPAQNSGTFTGLDIGTYTITVTDSNGCTEDTTIMIDAPALLTLDPVSNIDPDCHGASTGEIEVLASGGTTPYSFSINGGSGQSSSLFTNLSAGTYTITVTDANGCTEILIETLYDPTLVEFSSLTYTDINCSGATTVVTAVATGGTAPYTYTLSGGVAQTSGVFVGLSAGTYTVTITDSKGCTADSTFTISEPPVLGINAANTIDASCYGQSDGEISVTGTGGTTPYTYTLNGGTAQTSGTFTGLTAGTYTVTLTDTMGCTTDTTLTISQPTPVQFSSISTTPSACNVLNGTITVTASGGTPGYTYAIGASAFQGSGSFNNLGTGTYVVKAKDANGCEIDTTVAVLGVNSPQIDSITTQSPSCPAATDGSFTIHASSGAAPYSYTIVGGSLQSSSTFSGLAAGTYNVEVYDDNGCQATGQVTITDPTPVTVQSVSTTSPDCYGTFTGSISVGATGGTAPYTYAISGGATQATGTFTSLAAGTYTVTLEDDNGCINDTTITLTEPTPLNITLDSLSDPSCYGGNDGEIAINVSGGTPPYTYSNNGGPSQTSSTFTGLTAGTYNTVVTDANGCVDSILTLLIDPNQILLSALSTTPATCNSNNASLTAMAMGGTAPYTYALGTGAYQSSGTFAGLSAGTYTLHVLDDLGCTQDSTITIDALDAIVIDSTSFIPPSCNAGADGSLTVYASNGVAPYTYSLNGGAPQNSSTFNSLSAGTYTLVVTDSSGCVDSSTVVVTEPTAVVLSQLILQMPFCHGGSDGSINGAASGGTPPYTYSLNGGPAQGACAFGVLTAGTYSLQVIDAYGCIHDTSIVITEPAPLDVDNISVVNIACNGGSNGSINITATGGTAPYTYQLLGGTPQTSGVFNNLTAGTYTIVITDAHNCLIDTTINVQSAGSLVVDSVVTQDVSCTGNSDGSLTVYVSGGTPPYTYGLSGGASSSNNTFTNLTAGTYVVNITDTNNCTINYTVILSQPPVFSINATGSDPLCPDDSTGSITITATNGQGAIIYTYSGSPTTSPITGLSEGSYVIVGMDSAGCSDTAVVQLVDPVPITLGLLVSGTSCAGTQDGSMTATISNGVAPYTTSLNGAAYVNANNYNNLAPGSYTLSVQDANGCLKDTTFTILAPDTLTLSLSTKAESCPQTNDGQITVTNSGGGTPSYTYSIDGSTYTASNSFGNLAPGFYTVWIKDANGCIKTDTITVIAAEPILYSLTKTDPECTYGGTLDVSVSGGATPYLFVLGSLSQYDSSFVDIDSGTYVFSITDANGCTLDTTLYFVSPDYPEIVNIETIEPLCYGDRNGAIEVTVNNLNPPYTYSLDSTQGYQNSSTFYGLASGDYIIYVRDKDLCRDSISVTLDQPEELVINLEVENNNCATPEPDGNITVLPEGGIPPYTYQWTPMFADTAMIDELPNGTYQIVVLDSNGCMSTASTDIIEDNCCVPFLPNAFTPNNDGVNDFFEIYNLDEMIELRAFIYDRYGNEVYYGYNDLRWDGRLNNRDVEIGVYFIKVQYTCRGWGNKEFEYIGEVHLLR